MSNTTVWLLIGGGFLALILFGVGVIVVAAVRSRREERANHPARVLLARQGRIGIQKPAKSTQPVTKRERILNERQGRRDGYINSDRKVQP